LISFAWTNCKANFDPIQTRNKISKDFFQCNDAIRRKLSSFKKIPKIEANLTKFFSFNLCSKAIDEVRANWWISKFEDVINRRGFKQLLMLPWFCNTSYKFPHYLEGFSQIRSQIKPFQNFLAIGKNNHLHINSSEKKLQQFKFNISRWCKNFWKASRTFPQFIKNLHYKGLQKKNSDRLLRIIGLNERMNEWKCLDFSIEIFWNKT